MSKEKFSFSKITTFNNCNHNYYLNYVCKPRPYNEQNIYGEIGTTCHEAIEGLIKNTITTDDAKKRLISDIEGCELLDMNFPKYNGTDSIKNNYIECVNHYFDNYEPYCVTPDYDSIEEPFNIDICGIHFRGFIDYYYIKGENLYCIDFKTSSKFSKKDLEKKKLQLIIYGLYLKKKYPTKKIHCYFDMLKYVTTKRGALKERNKIDMFDDLPSGLVEVEFNEQNINDLYKFINENIEKLNSLDKENIDDWLPMKDFEKSYFCKTLCGFKKTCKHYKKLTNK